jgi:hypothetical protein
MLRYVLKNEFRCLVTKPPNINRSYSNPYCYLISANIQASLLTTSNNSITRERWEFDVHVTVYRDTLLTIKPNRCTKFSKFIVWNETLHVWDSSSVHHQEFFTVRTTMAYVRKPVWHIPLLCVQWTTPDDGQRNGPKHVDFNS